MKIATRDFGEVEMSEDAVITFRQPILGFEQYRTFVMIVDESIGEKFAWLQSTEEQGLCFIMFDPSELQEQYVPVLPDQIDALLEGSGAYTCWVLTSIGKEFSKATVNLKSPIILCEESHLAAQVVLEQSYPIRFPLMKGED